MSAKIFSEHPVSFSGHPVIPPLLSARRESLKVISQNDVNIAKLLQESAKVEAEETKKFAFYENIRLRVKYYLQSTWYGALYKRVLLVFSIASVFLYILETYFEKESNTVSTYM